MKMLRCDACALVYQIPRNRREWRRTPPTCAEASFSTKSACLAPTRVVRVPDCPCCHPDTRTAQRGWLQKRGSLGPLVRAGFVAPGKLPRWTGGRAYRLVDDAGAITFVAEPYPFLIDWWRQPILVSDALLGDSSTSRSRAVHRDLRHLRELGFTVKITAGDGLHYPTRTVRIAIEEPRP